MHIKITDVASRKFIEKCMGTSQKVWESAIRDRSELPETSNPGCIRYCLAEDVAYIFQNDTWWCMGRLRHVDRNELLDKMHHPNWNDIALDNYDKGLLKEILDKDTN